MNSESNLDHFLNSWNISPDDRAGFHGQRLLRRGPPLRVCQAAHDLIVQRLVLPVGQDFDQHLVVQQLIQQLTQRLVIQHLVVQYLVVQQLILQLAQQLVIQQLIQQLAQHLVLPNSQHLVIRHLVQQLVVQQLTQRLNK